MRRFIDTYSYVLQGATSLQRHKAMPSRHLSFRLDADVFDRLEAESRRTKRPRPELIKTLLDEGLRMEAHPGILFRPGPAGRRLALAGGPDVWEVARVYRDLPLSGEDAMKRAAELTSLNLQQVRTAVQYYADYQEEIDEWIDAIDEEAEKAHAAWQRRQKLLGE